VYVIQTFIIREFR